MLTGVHMIESIISWVRKNVIPSDIYDTQPGQVFSEGPDENYTFENPAETVLNTTSIQDQFQLARSAYESYGAWESAMEKFADILFPDRHDSITFSIDYLYSYQKFIELAPCQLSSIISEAVGMTDDYMIAATHGECFPVVECRMPSQISLANKDMLVGCNDATVQVINCDHTEDMFEVKFRPPPGVNPETCLIRINMSDSNPVTFRTAIVSQLKDIYLRKLERNLQAAVSNFIKTTNLRFNDDIFGDPKISAIEGAIAGELFYIVSLDDQIVQRKKSPAKFAFNYEKINELINTVYDSLDRESLFQAATHSGRLTWKDYFKAMDDEEHLLFVQAKYAGLSALYYAPEIYKNEHASASQKGLLDVIQYSVVTQKLLRDVSIRYLYRVISEHGQGYVFGAYIGNLIVRCAEAGFLPSPSMFILRRSINRLFDNFTEDGTNKQHFDRAVQYGFNIAITMDVYRTLPPKIKSSRLTNEMLAALLYSKELQPLLASNRVLSRESAHGILRESFIEDYKKISQQKIFSQVARSITGSIAPMFFNDMKWNIELNEISIPNVKSTISMSKETSSIFLLTVNPSHSMSEAENKILSKIDHEFICKIHVITNPNNSLVAASTIERVFLKGEGRFSGSKKFSQYLDQQGSNIVIAFEKHLDNFRSSNKILYAATFGGITKEPAAENVFGTKKNMSREKAFPLVRLACTMACNALPGLFDSMKDHLSISSSNKSILDLGIESGNSESIIEIVKYLKNKNTPISFIQRSLDKAIESYDSEIIEVFLREPIRMNATQNERLLTWSQVVLDSGISKLALAAVMRETIASGMDENRKINLIQAPRRQAEIL